MKLFQIPILLLILNGFTLSNFAQVPDIPSNIDRKPSKEEIANKRLEQKKEVIEQILVDAEKLENPEHRATAFSKAGQFLCEFDKNRAKKIFEKSFNELIILQNKIEIDENDDLKKFNSLSSQRLFIVFQSISDCDPELAYEYLYKSRTKNLSRMLDQFYKDPTSVDRKMLGWLQSESNFETNLQSKIIRVNPERAVEFINHNLNSVITNSTLDFLKTLDRSNPSLSEELTDKVVNKLLDIKLFSDVDKKPIYSGSQFNYIILNSFLRTLGDNKQNKRYLIKVSDDLLSKLAYKVITETIENDFTYIDEDALAVIKRFHPSQIWDFEQMKSERLKTPEVIEAQKFNELKKNNPPSEILLSSVKDFSNSYQQEIYKLTACKLVEENKFNQAKTLFESNYSDEFYRDVKLSMLIYSNASKKWKLGKYQEAEDLISQISDLQLRIDALATLAEIIFNKKQDKEKALSYLATAENIVNQNLNSVVFSEAMVDIISAYALIDPETAFLKFDKLLNHTDFSDKPFVSFKKYSEFKDIGLEGYFGIKNGFNFNPIVSRLKNISFEKTLGIINKNKEPWSRIFSKTHLFEKRDSYDISNIPNECNF